MAEEDKIPCRTPTKGRNGVTNIPAFKFAMLSKAISDVLRDGDVAFSELKDAVGARLSDADRNRIGSLGWHVTTVKLELEVRGDIARLPKTVPQRLTWVGQ